MESAKLEALIWNLQLPQSTGDSGADHNMRIAKDRLQKAITTIRADERAKCAERMRDELERIAEDTNLETWVESLSAELSLAIQGEAEAEEATK